MDPESSPFSPGQPVPIELFVGRIAEINRLKGMVESSLKGRFKIGFVVGERGIGKSSLVSFVRHLSEREKEVAGCHVFLGGVKELHEMVRRAFDRLLKESVEKAWHSKVREFFGRHVKEIGLFGVSVALDLSEKELRNLTNDFVPSLAQLMSQLKEDRKAVLLVLDDINGLASSAEFANWLKCIVDEISTQDRPYYLCLLIVGLEDRRQSLVDLQPSLARVFEIIDIKPWSDGETREFFEQSFTAAGAKVTEDQLRIMVQFSGGLPVLAHEIGDAVWRTSSSLEFDTDEILAGIFGAAEVIGRKFLEPQVVRALRSPRYRSILRKMSNQPISSIRRADLIKRLTQDEKRVMDNFLQKMKKIGALTPDEQTGPGGYRFPNHLHALYFYVESQRAKHENK